MSLIVNSSGSGGGGAAPTGPAGGSLAGTYPNPSIAAGAVGTPELASSAVTAAKVDGTLKPSGSAAAGTEALRALGTTSSTAAAGNDSRLSDSRAPSGAAGGSLAGTYPNPTIAAGAVTDVEVATANKDGVAATASMRTIGAGAQQAAAGNHTHTVPDASDTVKGVTKLSVAAASPTNPIAVGDNDSRMTNSRAPSGTAGGSLAGTYPNPSIAAGAVGTSELAALGVTTAKIAANAVTAAKIDASLQGGAAAGTEALRAIGTTATTACAGNDSRLSDSRAPSGSAGGSLGGTYPNPTIASSVSLPGSPTTTTQSAGDNSTKVATTAYVDAATPLVTANTQTGSYTLVLSDAGKAVEMNSASATVLTIPPNSSVAFPTGTVIEIARIGAGTVTITDGSGVTIPNRVEAAGTTSRTIANQWSSASIRKRATDVWVLVGDIA